MLSIVPESLSPTPAGPREPMPSPPPKRGLVASHSLTPTQQWHLRSQTPSVHLTQRPEPWAECGTP
ncbi:mCG1047858 [Mus musculus]|nr:mCG1047858 [Mus musculus]